QYLECPVTAGGENARGTWLVTRTQPFLERDSVGETPPGIEDVHVSGIGLEHKHPALTVQVDGDRALLRLLRCDVSLPQRCSVRPIRGDSRCLDVDKVERAIGRDAAEG